ncbi:MAG: ATP-binding cassette domain-containing protein [Armatimonadetes bacterium]|nr:ATP-binding cassette domain-containing protein [Armatimonadota bacterium]
MITTTSLSKSFKDPKVGLVKAVDDVSFEARPGQVFGLLGINGAGKTTCLRMLSTVIRPTSGTATVAGHDIRTDPLAVRTQIGFLSASTALYGRLTGEEVLEYFGRLNGLDGAVLRELITYVKRAMNLHEFAGKLCDKMSTGQKQRVSIARTILHDPPVLFFDEPTAGLDVVTSQTVMEFIEEAKSRGRTIVFSTHIMSEAERLCDTVAVIHQGRLLSQGTTAEILAETGSPNLEKAFLKLVDYSPEGARP